MDNLKNRSFENPIYDDYNSLYNTLNKDNNKLNKDNYQYNILNRNNNNYNKLKIFNEDNIYQDINISNNNSKYKLPDDWIELIDEDSGKYYYACLTTKHTQWLHPSIPIGTIMENGLPYGWDCNIDPITNKKYYVNHVGRFNTWKPPVKQRKYKGSEYVWLVDL